MKASLVMFKADGSRRDFSLRPGCLVLGRKNSCELRIPLSSVSRQHCEIQVEGSDILLRDLGSSNGTYHNSVRVQNAKLQAGDEVVVGPVVFTVVVDGVPSDIEPVRTIVNSADSSTSAATVTPELATQDVEVISTITDEPLIGDDDTPLAAIEGAISDNIPGGPGESSFIDFDFDDLTDDD